jgi:hypothetical protein
MKTTLRSVSLFLACALSSDAMAQTKQEGSQTNKAARPVTRLIWQDNADQTVRWGDLMRSAEGLSLSSQAITGFPKLDAEKQSFVQMEDVKGLVVTTTTMAISKVAGSR